MINRTTIRHRLIGLEERNREREAKRRRILTGHLEKKEQGQARQYEKSAYIPKSGRWELTPQEREMNAIAEASLDRKERGICPEREARILLYREPPLPRSPLE